MPSIPPRTSEAESSATSTMSEGMLSGLSSTLDVSFRRFAFNSRHLARTISRSSAFWTERFRPPPCEDRDRFFVDDIHERFPIKSTSTKTNSRLQCGRSLPIFAALPLDPRTRSSLVYSQGINDSDGVDPMNRFFAPNKKSSKNRAKIARTFRRRTNVHTILKNIMENCLQVSIHYPGEKLLLYCTINQFICFSSDYLSRDVEYLEALSLAYRLTKVPPAPDPVPAAPPASTSFNKAWKTRPSVMKAPPTPSLTALVA